MSNLFNFNNKSVTERINFQWYHKHTTYCFINLKLQSDISHLLHSLRTYPVKFACFPSHRFHCHILTFFCHFLFFECFELIQLIRKLVQMPSLRSCRRWLPDKVCTLTQCISAWIGLIAISMAVPYAKLVGLQHSHPNTLSQGDTIWCMCRVWSIKLC